MPVSSSYDSLWSLILARAGDRELTVKDYNFKDYEEQTLLYRACVAGDLETVKDLLAKGAELNQLNTCYKSSALEAALEYGHLELAQFLLSSGGKLFKLRFSLCHSSTQEWLRSHLLAAIDEAQSHKGNINLLAGTNQQLIHKESMPLIDRLAEVYDERLHQNFLNQLIAGDSKYKGVRKSLWYAVQSRNSAYIKQVLACRKYDYDPTKKPYFNYNAFLSAVSQKQFELAGLFVSDTANLNCQDQYGNNMLLLAAEKRSEAGIEFALNYNVNLLTTNRHGDNVLHLLASSTNPSLFALVKARLKDDEFCMLQNQKNMYQISPQEMLDKNIKRTPVAPKIDQTPIINNIRYYLEYKDRSLEFTSDGYCNGLEVLFFYYASKGKWEYFFSTLDLLANWDGDMGKLEKDLPDDAPQKEYYRTLGDLFEGWIYDITWFQHTGVETISSYSHRDIVEHFKMVQHEEPKPRIVSCFNHPNQTPNISLSCLEERFVYFLRMPKVFHLQIGGAAHATGGFKTTADQVLYYDSNINYELSSTPGAHQLAMNVFYYKYTVLNKLTSDEKMSMTSRIICADDPEVLEQLEDFELFSQDELPKSKEAAELFSQNSPSGYTHLHLAVLFCSKKNVAALLEAGHIDASKKDKFGFTAFDYVNLTKNNHLVYLFYQFGHGDSFQKLYQNINLHWLKTCTSHLICDQQDFDILVNEYHLRDLQNLKEEGILKLENKNKGPSTLCANPQRRQFIQSFLSRAYEHSVEHGVMCHLVLLLVGNDVLKQLDTEGEALLNLLAIELVLALAFEKRFGSIDTFSFILKNLDSFMKLYQQLGDFGLTFVSARLLSFNTTKRIDNPDSADHDQTKTVKSYAYLPADLMQCMLKHPELFSKLVTIIPVKKLLAEYSESLRYLLKSPEKTNRLIEAGATALFFLRTPAQLNLLYDNVETIIKLTDKSNAHPLTFWKAASMPIELLYALSERPEQLEQRCATADWVELVKCKGNMSMVQLLETMEQDSSFAYKQM